MKSVLTLKNPLWRTAQRRLILDKAVQRSGAELESRIKQKILTGPKSGKLYRRSAIKKRIAKRDLGFYRSNRKIFRRTFTTLFNEKTTVGYLIHRASKRGESPATSTGSLVGSIRAVKLGYMSVRVASSKRYALRLDSKQGLDRPFFEATVTEYKPIFKQNISEAIRGNS